MGAGLSAAGLASPGPLFRPSPVQASESLLPESLVHLDLVSTRYFPGRVPRTRQLVCNTSPWKSFSGATKRNPLSANQESHCPPFSFSLDLLRTVPAVAFQDQRG